jgi:hypothetical protein
MYFSWRLIRTLTVAAALLTAGNAHAIVLNWSDVSWKPGSLSNSYDIDGHPTNGNDITIALSGNTNKLTVDPATGMAAPHIGNSLQGGHGGDHSLFLGGDLSTQTNFTVTVSFTGGSNAASNVSFKLFDIDMGVDRERILNIYGLLSDGTRVAATISGIGSAVSLTGTGLSQVLTGNVASADTGANSGNGNATISFGAHTITSFTFDFKNDGGPARFQSIGLFDIDFTPVPEINPAVVGAAACLFAGVIAFRFRRAPRAA